MTISQLPFLMTEAIALLRQSFSPCPCPTIMAVGETLPTSAMVAEDVSDISLLSDHSELSECSDLSSLSSSRLSSPTFYPSPPPSQRLDSEQRSCGTSRARASGPDDSQDSDQPAKKKRRVGPKPRSTQHLDVSRASPLTYTNQQAQIDLLTKTLRTHRKIVVIAGAGISTSAGSKLYTPLIYIYPGKNKKQKKKIF